MNLILGVLIVAFARRRRGGFVPRPVVRHADEVTARPMPAWVQALPPRPTMH